VTGGVKTDSNSEVVGRLAVGQGLQIDIAQAPTKHQFSRRRGEVMRTPSPGVIGMRVSDDSAVDGLPRVDIEVAGGAVEALGTLNDQIGVHEIGSGTAAKSTGGPERRTEDCPNHL
jgi:hypothetical protein